jgi:hypothetical protein
MTYISNHNASGKPHDSKMKCEINKGGDKRETQTIYKKNNMKLVEQLATACNLGLSHSTTSTL